MRELPKELTAELLSLVLNKKIKKINNSTIDGNVYYWNEFSKCKSKLNIDTLTRLMKEWCFTYSYIVSSEITVEYNNSRIATARLRDLKSGNLTKSCPLFLSLKDTEFEAVLKATHWVAKTKGLI